MTEPKPAPAAAQLPAANGITPEEAMAQMNVLTRRVVEHFEADLAKAGWPADAADIARKRFYEALAPLPLLVADMAKLLGSKVDAASLSWSRALDKIKELEAVELRLKAREAAVETDQHYLAAHRELKRRWWAPLVACGMLIGAALVYGTLWIGGMFS